LVQQLAECDGNNIPLKDMSDLWQDLLKVQDRDKLILLGFED
jgi:hypothetical protein